MRVSNCSQAGGGMSRFPLLPLLVACAAALAHKQLSSIPGNAGFSLVALFAAIGFGKSSLTLIMSQWQAW